MNDRYDPLAWFSKWPHDKVSITDAWSKVHSRFGFAADEGNKLETALVMLISQTQQISRQELSFDDLLKFLEQNGSLTLGRLVHIFESFFSISTELKEALDIAVKRRNYLIHHFYRHRSELFYRPDGCETMHEELVSIQDDLNAALELLSDWKDKTFGSIPDEDRWDRINEDVEKWKREQEAMLKAILGKKDMT